MTSKMMTITRRILRRGIAIKRLEKVVPLKKLMRIFSINLSLRTKRKMLNLLITKHQQTRTKLLVKKRN
jgi:hypothetical protein